MKRVLIDTNVVLDVLLDRQPHARGSVAVWAAIEAGSTEGLLAAHAVTTIHYLIRRELGTARAKRTISAMPWSGRAAQLRQSPLIRTLCESTQPIPTSPLN